MTGNPGPAETALRWLGSTKNIAGAALAVAGVVAEFTLGLGPLWPVAVAGLYGVGALLAPPEKVDLTGALGTGVDVRKLREDLASLVRHLAKSRNRLGDDVCARVDTITGLLEEILQRGDALAGTPHLYVVGATIRDYLPTSLEAYLNLPRTYAMASRTEGRKSAHDELIGQLDILANEAEKIRSAVYDNDATALADQGRFLADKFRTSSLDL